MSVFSSNGRKQNPATWLRELWATYVESGDVTALLVTAVLLLMPALALDAAEWKIELGIALPVMFISIGFGYFLSRSRYNELYALIVAGLYGLVVVLVVAAFSQSWNPFSGLQIVITRSFEWIVDVFTGGINQDSLVFTLVVSILFWFFGYNAAWHIFRIDRVWRVIIPPALILLVNMVVYAGETSLDFYLMSFALMSLLLIVRSNLEAREYDWYLNGVRVPKNLRRQFTAVGAAISLSALVFAWLIPTGNLQERLDNFQEFLASDPVRQFAEFMNRLVEPIESEGPATSDYYGGDSLNLGGAIRLGDQVIMLIEAPASNRYYWRSRVFERYENGRWVPSATRRVPDLSPPMTIIQPAGGDLGRVNVNQTITMNSPSRLIYSAPQPLSISVGGRIDLYRTSGDQEDANSPMNVSVIRPDRVLERGMFYTVTSAMTVASAFDLRAAGTNYPDWVVNPNANPSGVTARVAALARDIVAQAGATTPYDQAKAIETYLRTNITYNETIAPPPAGVDPIEYFLFESREGYCTYYATAMIAMLRSLGIPARMAAGFAQGEFDASLNNYVVRERDAHTWVEVYFPGYGWVEFEPTTAQAPLNRDGDEVQPESNQTGVEPSQEPTMTPTPQATATPEPSPTQADTAGQEQDSPATFTPTPSPTPTATPIILPTIAPPVTLPDPPQTDFLSFLLPAIGLAFMIFMSILLLILVVFLIFWWWEWRGMGGLSPISRAYTRLMRYIGLIGLRPSDNSTPEERRREIIRNLPQAERPISAITRSYTIERYSNKPEGTAESAGRTQAADEAWLDARRSILIKWLRKFIPFLKD